MLEMRLIKTQKKIRVDVFRRYKSIDPATQKSKFHFKQLGSLGSLPIDHDDFPELWGQLEPDEIMQLHNWLAETRFGESFQIAADQLKKVSVRMPIPLLTALTRLSLEAGRAGLDFIPHQIILNTLLEQARRIEEHIDLKNGFKSGILASAGVPVLPDTLEETNCASDPESHTLFQTLLDLKQPVGRTCTALEATAARYGKIKKIAPPQLHEWAGNLKYKNPHKKIKKWCYAIAIDVLHEQGINATQFMSPTRVADFWIRLNVSRYSVLEAPVAFIRLFEVKPEHHAAVMSVIAHIYETLPVPLQNGPLAAMMKAGKTE
ncbi:MAG: hypothetical protein JSR33_00975 [Proteobacteria bacterium]|nr:hypothetical protein [Pseudomonadota bacterium]